MLRSVAALAAGRASSIVLGAGGGVGLAAVQLGAILGASVTAVASSPEKLDVAAALRRAATSSTIAPAICGQALREMPPRGRRRRRSIPSVASSPSPRCAALRYGGRFVTVGYASGVIPRIPLNLVLLKGVHDARLPVLDFVDPHGPTRSIATSASCSSCSHRGRVVPHIGAPFSLDDAAAALRYVADGQAIGKVVIDIG